MNNYKNKTTNTLITEDHFKMFLKHDSETCLCPNPDHNDNEPGSLSFVKFSTENIGIHCWCCDKTWNLYDTLKMVDKNSLLKYNTIIKTIDYDKIKENEIFEKKVRTRKNGSVIVEKKDKFYKNFDLKRYYNTLTKIQFNENDYKIYGLNDYYTDIVDDQLNAFIPFLPFLSAFENGLKHNIKLLNSLRFEQYNESLVIPFVINECWCNTFYYRDKRGKYVPKLGWYRNGEDFYDMPIFWDECFENKKVNNNNFVIICEGVKDAFNANLLGYSALTSGGVTNTKPFSQYAINKIEEEFEYVVIALDNDEAGRKNIFRYTELFKNRKVKLVILTKAFNEDEDLSDFFYRKLIWGSTDFRLKTNN